MQSWGLKWLVEWRIQGLEVKIAAEGLIVSFQAMAVRGKLKWEDFY